MSLPKVTEDSIRNSCYHLAMDLLIYKEQFKDDKSYIPESDIIHSLKRQLKDVINPVALEIMWYSNPDAILHNFKQGGDREHAK